MLPIRNVGQIVEGRLCIGCGACAYICPNDRVRLADFVLEGIRPIVDRTDCVSCTECLQVCPGYENDHTELNRRPGIKRELADSCGPVLEIWEGHAADSEIRFAGASGGVITALALYCLERNAMYGVLHVGMDPADPTRSKTTMSRSRADLVANTGSRYAPASACDRLGLIESAPSACVFIGQPSEVTALRKAENLRPALRQNVGLAISFFCAGSPSRKGTLDLLQKIGIAPDQLASLRYRGNGWPGFFTPCLKDGTHTAPKLTYQESWRFIQAYRPFSTHLIPDGTGEDADISCGDPWYREIPRDEPGLSLVVVRTERGKQIIKAAMASNYVSLRPAETWKLIESQRNLIAKRGAVGGRIATLRAIGLPSPRLRGFSLAKNWYRLPWMEKLRSTVGTFRRAAQRGYFRPLRLEVPATSEKRSR